jgi:hypothetical protein
VNKDSSAAPQLRVVVFPSGPARQFRVQYLASPSTGWQKFAVYPRRTQAQACVDRLQIGGYEARLVENRYFPVAG